MNQLLKILGALFFALLLHSTAYAGFGITPPYVYNDRLTQGSQYTQKIIIVRGDPVDDLKAEVSINVEDAGAWFDIDRGTEFLLPEGESKVPIHVTVSVPDDAPLGRYQGNIRIKTVPSELGSGVSIALGAQIDVDVRVVDEIRDFEVKRVQIEEAEEPHRFWWLDFPGKILFTTTIENTGNAPVAPSRVAFEIFDRRGVTLLEQTQHTNTLPKVPEFETRELVAELPTFLPPGSYLVKYSIIHYEDQVKREGELTLSVLPAGSIEGYAGYGFMGLSALDKATLLVPAVLLVLMVVIGGGYLIYRRRRPRGGDPPQRRFGRGPSQEAKAEGPQADQRTAAPADAPPAPAPEVGAQTSRQKRRAAPSSTLDLSRRNRKSNERKQ